MKKPILLSVILCFIFLLACEKENIDDNSANEITTSAPLIDFGEGTYRGYQGGLYPDGSNQRPSNHNAAGLTIAKNVKPLDSEGNNDGTNGKIV